MLLCEECFFQLIRQIHMEPFDKPENMGKPY